MTSTEYTLYWIGILTMFLGMTCLLGVLAYYATISLCKFAEHFYTARRVIYAMHVVWRWERRKAAIAKAKGAA